MLTPVAGATRGPLLPATHGVSRGPPAPADRHARRRDVARLRQPDRRDGSVAVVLRPRRVRPSRPGDEDDRRRAGAARTDLRRLRAGRARARRRRARALADVRDRRRRSHRRRAGRPDRRAVPVRARAQLPPLQPRDGTGGPARRGRHVLASLPERLRRRAQRDLEHLGVEIRLQAIVVGVNETGLDVEGGRIEARTKIWAAGVQASSLGRLLANRVGASVERSGRVEVEPDCWVAGHPELFVVGDLMALDVLPGLAEVAMRAAATPFGRSFAPCASSRPSRSAIAISAPWPRLPAAGRSRPSDGSRSGAWWAD
jgi:Pyridine nucleotide-disulphide oxidoreductase